MVRESDRGSSPRVVVIADVESNARHLVDRVLLPAGIRARTNGAGGPEADVLVVDVTQLRGDPLAGLRDRREGGDKSPAIVLAAHFPVYRLRDLFRLGVGDVLLKPYRPTDLYQAIHALAEARAAELKTLAMARRAQSRRRTEEITLVSGIGRAVVSLEELDEILTRVVEAAAFVTKAEEANIYLVEPDTDEVVLRASKQSGKRHGTLQRLRITDTLAGHVYRTGQPVMRQPMRGGAQVKVQTGFLVQSLIKVPIRLESTVVGVLGVYNRFSPREFTEHHMTLLMALADWVGVALEHSILIKRIRGGQRPQGMVPATSPRMRQGLEHTLTSLEKVLGSGQEMSMEEQKAVLLDVQSRLRSILDIPVAVVDPEQVGMVDVRGMLNHVASFMQPKAERRGINLSVDCGAAIPLFFGDRQRIYQVVEALVAAAIDRTNKGSVSLKSRRTKVQDGKPDGDTLPVTHDWKDGIWATVSVEDTGEPLSPDVVDALTSPSVDPHAGRVGAGLSMGEIRMITESMGGLLWLEQESSGASVYLALPID